MKLSGSRPGSSAVRRLAAAAAVAAAVTSRAQATCGSANCFLVTGTQEGMAGKGRIVVDLSWRSIEQDRRLEGRDEVDEVLTPRIDFENEVIEPNHHRELRTDNQLVQVDVSWGMTERLTLGVSLPLINDRDHEHFDEVGTPEEHFVDTDGTSGFGDVRVGLRGTLHAGKSSLLIGGAALKLPTGEYRLRDSEGAIGEPTIMPGSGSTDLVLFLHYSRLWASSSWEAFVSGGWRMSRENPLDYEMGDETIVSAGARRRAGERATWSAQLNMRHTGRDAYRGDPVASTGADFVNLTPGLWLHAGEDLGFYGYLQVPVYQDVRETQLAPGIGLLLGVSKSF